MPVEVRTDASDVLSLFSILKAACCLACFLVRATATKEYSKSYLFTVIKQSYLLKTRLYWKKLTKEVQHKCFLLQFQTLLN